MTAVTMLRLVFALAIACLAAPAAAVPRAESSSGDAIAYSVWHQAVPDTWLAGGGLCIVGAEGGRSRRLTGPEFDVTPAWAPNGRRFAFASAGERPQRHGYDVYVQEVATGAVKNVTRGESWGEFNFDPAWSPDGRRLALVVGSGQHDVIVVHDLVSGDATAVGGAPQALAPTWSPDGRRIAYAGSTPEGATIFEVAVERPDPRVLIARASQPEWSPDGERLAYVGAEGDVFVALADGSEPRALTQTREIESEPHWSPDGTRLAFARALESGSTIVVANVDGSGEREVARSPFLLSSPVWRPLGGLPAARPCLLEGSARSDRLRGTAQEDVVMGAAGSDRVSGLAARDSLDGGAGNDIVEGGAGNDVVIGGPGSDLLSGGIGRDSVWARDGDPDSVRCGAGRDYVYADFRDTWTDDCEAVSRQAARP